VDHICFVIHSVLIILLFRHIPTQLFVIIVVYHSFPPPFCSPPLSFSPLFLYSCVNTTQKTLQKHKQINQHQLLSTLYAFLQSIAVFDTTNTQLSYIIHIHFFLFFFFCWFCSSSHTLLCSLTKQNAVVTSPFTLCTKTSYPPNSSALFFFFSPFVVCLFPCSGVPACQEHVGKPFTNLFIHPKYHFIDIQHWFCFSLYLHSCQLPFQLW